MTAGLLNNGKIVLDDKIINTIDISSATIDIIVKAEKAGVKIDYKKIDRPQYIMNLILEILKPKETLQFKEKYTDGTATEPFCYYHSEEFDPSIPINYWDGDNW